MSLWLRHPFLDLPPPRRARVTAQDLLGFAAAAGLTFGFIWWLRLWMELTIRLGDPVWGVR